MICEFWSSTIQKSPTNMILIKLSNEQMDRHILLYNNFISVNLFHRRWWSNLQITLITMIKIIHALLYLSMSMNYLEAVYNEWSSKWIPLSQNYKSHMLIICSNSSWKLLIWPWGTEWPLQFQVVQAIIQPSAVARLHWLQYPHLMNNPNPANGLTLKR